MREDRSKQHDLGMDKYAQPVNVDYQMTVRDYVLRPKASSTPIIITLPPVAEARGRFYSIIADTCDATNTITITDRGHGAAGAGSDSEQWEGDTVLWKSGQGQLFYSDGMKWMLRTFSDITVLDIDKLEGRIYSNQSGYDQTVLKIHNHDNTAEIGGLETKGEFKNASGRCLGQGNYWSYEPTGDTGAPTTLAAGEFVVAVDTGITVTTGNIYGIHGQIQLYGTLDGAAVTVTGVAGIIAMSGANTQVLHMAGVGSGMGQGLVNPTTGTLSYYLASSVSTVIVDNMLCLAHSQYVTNFASFNAADTDKCVEVNTNTLTLAPTSYHIRVLIEGNVGYIPVFDNKTWT